MGLKLLRGRQSRRRGSAVVQTMVFSALVGVGAMALTVDTGLQFNARGEAQAAADAAALAAALELGSSQNAASSARQAAHHIASQNKIRGLPAYVDPNVDVQFGHAVLNGSRYEFLPEQLPYDAVKVTVRRDGSDSNHPKVPLMFGQAFFSQGTNVSASAIAMLVPRDIAIVFDLSASMNDDSEIRHSRSFTSETNGQTRPGVQINLKEVWAALPISRGRNGIGNGRDPAAPGGPTSNNDQPATGSGIPQSEGGNPDPGPEPAGGSSNPAGPRWGWMTGWGAELQLGSWSPASDFGLYHVPRSATCTDPDVIANLTEAGYSAAERSALLSGSKDSNFTLYSNRVRVCLGLAGWASKKSGGKYSGGSGNGDDTVDSGELVQAVSWLWPNGGSWSDWVTYVSSNSSQMFQTDSRVRYRYGIKTVVNYLLEKQAQNAKVPELAAAPEMPLRSAKDAVQAMIDLIIDLDTQDHCSLEIFATTGRHEVNLSVPSGSQTLASALQVIPSVLYQRQAGHYNSTTCIGCGLAEGIRELQSARARSAAAKVIVLLTDGKPNVGGNGLSPEAYSLQQASVAGNAGMTIYAIGLGADVDPALLQQIASIGHGEYFYADSAPDPLTGRPLYETQLREIFEQLGGKRPVRLIK